MCQNLNYQFSDEINEFLEQNNREHYQSIESIHKFKKVGANMAKIDS